MALVGDDCFFFLNSGCVRGSQCTFRHQPAARSATIVCPQWLQRCCFSPSCVYRHTDDVVSRNQTPCYFEASTGVCYKPRCAFAHVRKPVPIPTPPPPPGLPPLPGLHGMPPILPTRAAAPPVPTPLPASHPLPNNLPVVRPDIVGEIPGANTNVAPPVKALTPPPPGLPSPPKLTEMLLGTKLPTPVKEPIHSSTVPQQPPPAARQIPLDTLGTAPTANASKTDPVPTVPTPIAASNIPTPIAAPIAAPVAAPSVQTQAVAQVTQHTPIVRAPLHAAPAVQASVPAVPIARGPVPIARGTVPNARGTVPTMPVIRASVPAVPVPRVALPHARGSSPAIPVGRGSVPLVRAPVVAAPVVGVFPKNDHFNEQVRLFKEMLAAKSSQSQRKNNNGYYSDEDRSGGAHRSRERQRSKKERREKEGYKSHKSSRSSKEQMSRADEEILYGDYKDVPLHQKEQKHKKKKKHRHREYADSEPEVKELIERSYEEILREKALRKLHSRRKEMKFNEDFKELVDVSLTEQQDPKSAKSDRVNDGLPDKVTRKKKYNSEGEKEDSAEDEAREKIEEYKQKLEEREDYETSREYRRRKEKKELTRDQRSQHYVHDDPLTAKKRNDSESREHSKHSKKHSKKSKHKEKKNDDDEIQLIEVDSSVDDSQDSVKEVTEEETEKDESEDSSSDSSDDEQSSDSSDSDGNSYSDISENEVVETTKKSESVDAKKAQIIIPDETTNIDFNVDLDDELAMEINQNDPSYAQSKSKKLRSSVVSVVVPMKANASGRDKSKKSSDSKTTRSSRHSKRSKENPSEKSSNSKKSNRSKKSPEVDESKTSNKVVVENKKVVRLVNTPAPDKPLLSGKQTNKTSRRSSPTGTPGNDATDTVVEKTEGEKNIKVKSFDEIMAEKQKRNKTTDYANGATTATDNEPGAKNIKAATLKEKSTRAKLEVLNCAHKGSEQNDVTINPTPTPPVKNSRVKLLTDDEKQKRKSIQLYKPPHPAKDDSVLPPKTTEVKMVVNTGPRKIIRIQKASLSTDIVDGTMPVINMDVTAGTEKTEKPAVNVRSFDEIIREKRARQKKERELAAQMEKENAASKANSAVTSTNNLIRRKPFLRRAALPTTTAVNSSTSDVPNTTTTAVLSNTNTSNAESAINEELANTNNIYTNKRPDNVAKVSPLNVVPPKRIKPDPDAHVPAETPQVVTPKVVTSVVESLENKDLYSRIRSSASRRASINNTNNKTKENERTPVTRLRKRSVASSNVDTSMNSEHVPNHVALNEKISTPLKNVALGSSQEVNVETNGPSRKDIQDALDEERRKREEDILSDDEFEKELNELGSDDEDGTFDDMNEDDLMMELEQMIDS